MTKGIHTAKIYLNKNNTVHLLLRALATLQQQLRFTNFNFFPLRTSCFGVDAKNT